MSPTDWWGPNSTKQGNVMMYAMAKIVYKIFAGLGSLHMHCFLLNMDTFLLR